MVVSNKKYIMANIRKYKLQIKNLFFFLILQLFHAYMSVVLWMIIEFF